MQQASCSDGSSKVETVQQLARGFPTDVVNRVATLLRNNEYQRRQMLPGLIVTGQAFGAGRRHPIAQKFRA